MIQATIEGVTVLSPLFAVQHQSRLCSTKADVRFGPIASPRAQSTIDQLVGTFEHRRWNSQTELSRGLDVDNELKFCRLLDRKITRLRTFKNHVHIVGGTTLNCRKTRPVRNQAASVHKFP